jgi:AraC-like DNA-binding protein
MQTYNLQKLKELLRDFHSLTGMKICIYDNNENELCFYPEKLSSFCKLLREDGAMDARCRDCDRRAFAECNKTHRQYVYTCHAGLIECVSPITYGGGIIGYVAIGQIKEDKHARLIDAIAKKDGELEQAFNSLPAMSRDKINSAIHIMDACTGYEYLKSLMTNVENDIESRISSYLANNLQGDLSVSKLCSVFHLSHSEIYAIFKTYFSSTPAEHIKKCRLIRACELLKSTKLQVNKIAANVGIPDYNYFSKIFKKEFSVSPRQYRKG